MQKLDQCAGGEFPGLLDLHIEPTPMDACAANILYRFRDSGHFAREEGYHVN